MTAVIVFLLLIVLIALALRHNHARQRDPRRPLYGSTTAVDRDAERIRSDVASLHSGRTGEPAGRRPAAAGYGGRHGRAAVVAGGGAVPDLSALVRRHQR